MMWTGRIRRGWGGVSLERKYVITSLKALGLKVVQGGIVEDENGRYAILGGNQIQLVDGTILDYDRIEFIEYNGLERELGFSLSDGTELSVPPGRLDHRDMRVHPPRQMPTSTSQLNAVFRELYPDVDSQVYYDVLMERDMIDMAMLDRPDDGIIPLSDKVLTVYHDHAENRLRELGFQGRFPSRAVMDECLTYQTYDHRRNAFREWVEAHEWDGVPRLHTWFRDTFGATAPALTPEEERTYLGDVAEAWFVGAVSRQYVTTHHEVVPVLISEQGIGKGLALRYTAGSDSWFIDTNVDVHETQRFLEGIRGRVIVEMSESTQLKRSDMEALKGFISKDVDQLRKSYARYEEEFPRHFVLVATSNQDNIFSDPTGNRRFFPMYCDPSVATRRFSVDRRVGQYDVEQVWAEALHLFRNGGRYYYPKKDVALAETMQEFCTVERPNVSRISEWLDSQPLYRIKGARITRATIFEECFGIDHGVAVSRDLESAYRNWAATDRAWKKVTSMRVNGVTSRGYERVMEPSEGRRPKASLGIVEDASVADRDAVQVRDEDPVEIMRAIVTREGCRMCGDRFPTEGLSQAVIEFLLGEGYIYKLGEGDYRIACLP